MENRFLLYSMLLGAGMSLLYDILRILRRLFPRGIVLVSLEDLLFWAFCSVQVFLLMQREGNGSLRWFAVLGALSGMMLYLKLISPLLLKYAVKLLKPPLELLKRWRKKTGERIRRSVKNGLTAIYRLIKMFLKRGMEYGRKNRDREEGLGGRPGKRQKKEKDK